MEEKSLRITGTDKTFFNKITKIGVYHGITYEHPKRMSAAGSIRGIFKENTRTAEAIRNRWENVSESRIRRSHAERQASW